MQTEIGPTNFSTDDERIVQEILRQAELQMQGLIENARAADQRAATVSGIQIAATLGLMALLGGENDWSSQSAMAILGAAICMFFAGIASSLALRPRKFFLLGNRPANWLEDVRTGRSLNDCLTDTLVFYERAITTNSQALQKKARALLWGLALTALTPLVAVMAYGTTQVVDTIHRTVTQFL